VDIVIGALFVLLTVAEALAAGSVRSPLVHILVAGGAMATLAWRRQYPLAVALLVVCANFFVNPDDEFSTLLSLVLVSFTVGAETVPPRNYLGLGVVFIPFLGGMVMGGLVPSDLAAAMVFIVGPWAVGSAFRQRAGRVEEAVSRAEQLERESVLRASLAASAERTRIARELHDIVSHSISVVTIQTQAVRRRLGPAHAKEAADLAAVEATAREALAEMRRLFGVLRADGESASLAPQPGLAELDRLVGQARTGDVDVSLQVEGEARLLPPGVDLAAFRIAQEGLTNALRHSGATEIRVRVRHSTSAVEVEVLDNGRGLRDTESRGHGILGIRERAALYGGTVELGPGPCGGARLAARLVVGETP
jgi:signal transduction histidine kinase